MKCPRCRRGTLRWVRVDVDAGEMGPTDEGFEFRTCWRCGWDSKAAAVEAQLTLGV